MSPVENLELLEGFEGLLYDMAAVYMIVCAAILIISFSWIFFYCWSGKVKQYSLLKMSAWFFATSPIVYSLTSSTIEALENYEQAYFQAKFYAKYGESAFENVSWDSLWSKSWQVSQTLNKELIVKIHLYSGANIAFKYLIPGILAGLGLWALAKFLDHRIKVVS